MNKAEFFDELKKLREQYPNPSKDKLETIELELKLILQDYLWVNNLGLKRLNNKAYYEISKAWHPDKLKDIQEDASQNEEIIFLKWYIQINGQNVAAPFQAVSFVKECYRPELAYRAKDAANKESGSTEYFYFVSSFAKLSGLLYSIFWPLFYLLEALERNIDNYPNETARLLAKKTYHFLSMLPFWICLAMLYVATDADAAELCYRLFQGSWIGNVLINGVIGSGILFLAVFLGVKAGERFLPAENTKQDIVYYVMALIYTPVLYYLNQLRNGPSKDKTASEKAGFYLWQLGGLAIFSLSALAQMASYGAWLYYSYPFIATMMAFPLGGLILVNIPLLTWQTYHQPKKSVEKVVEYFFTIFNRYYSLIKQMAKFTFDMAVSLAQKVRRCFPSRPKTADGQPPQQDPKASPPQNDPNQKVASNVAQNKDVPVPYWQSKLQKYLIKDSAVLLEKRKEARQERNGLLTSLKIPQDHAFYDVLDYDITEKSIAKDDMGFTIQSDNENMGTALQILNFKSQTVYLNKAKAKGLPLNLIQSEYRKENPDYHSLVEKPIKMKK